MYLEKQSVREMISDLARLYGVDPLLAITICQLESSLDPDAIGDGGASVGLYQWQLPSWEHVRAAMRLTPADQRKDPWQNIKTAMFAMGRLKLYNWWSTYHAALRRINSTSPQ